MNSDPMTTDSSTAESAPMFSRCSLGPKRWFWIVWPSFEAVHESNPCEQGYADSAEAAERIVFSKYPTATMQTAYWANHAHSKLVRANRKPSDSKEPKSVEYLWTYETSDFDGHDYWAEHPVVKKTAQRYYLLSCSDRCFTLHRSELETNGHAYGQHQTYYTDTGKAERQRSNQPAWANVLGIDRNAPLNEIQRAYRRKAIETHPDKGGDAEQFKAVVAAYEEGLSRSRAG
jgi:hypothetical protein